MNLFIINIIIKVQFGKQLTLLINLLITYIYIYIMHLIRKLQIKFFIKILLFNKLLTYTYIYI